MTARDTAVPAQPSAATPGSLPLTERQLEIIGLVASGYTNRRIAETLGITPATVKRHLERIYDRAGVRTLGRGNRHGDARRGLGVPRSAGPPPGSEPNLAPGSRAVTLHQ